MNQVQALWENVDMARNVGHGSKTVAFQLFKLVELVFSEISLVYGPAHESFDHVSASFDKITSASAIFPV